MQTCQTIIFDKVKQPLEEIEKSLTTTYRKDLFRPFVSAINEFELIEPGDKIAVALSGGKDSLLLAKLFQQLKRHNKFPFEIVFLSMDPGFNTINKDLLQSNCEYLNIPLITREKDVFEVIGKIAKDNPCYMCARMRRGFLYEQAKLLGCNKLALGHHFDDVIETTLLNMFYNGQFMTMVPKIEADNFSDIELIRPMIYIKEKDIKRWIEKSGINAMNCGCTVVAEKTSSKRREIKEMIETMRKDNPNVDLHIFKSATNINIDAIYGYHKDQKKYHFNELYQARRKIK